MKANIAFYLLLLYTFAMCKPLLPLVKDRVAHIFWEANHIATVHHHLGSHHAEAESASAAHDDEPGKVPAAAKASEPVSVHLAVADTYFLLEVPAEKQTFYTTSAALSSMAPDLHYPPPRNC